MFAIPEQLSTASKANIETQFSFLLSLLNKFFENTEKVIDLNLHVAKASLEESNDTIKKILAMPDFSGALPLLYEQAQPNAQKAIAYGQHWLSIASSTQAEFAKIAEDQIAESSRKAVALFNEVSHISPGTEPMANLFKSTIDGINAGVEQMTRNTNKVVEEMLENSNQFSQAVAKPGAKSKK